VKHILYGFAVFLAACSSGSVSDGTGPVTKPDTVTNPGGTVQRTSLTVRVGVDPADSSLATLAGLSRAGLTVRLLRSASGEIAREMVTRSDGSAVFDQLLEGAYEVSVQRTLTAAELARLDPSQRDITLFAAGSQIVVSPPKPSETRLDLVSSRRGSLVLSEVFGPRPSFGTAFYYYGDYTEITNVSDSTIFLDGIILFRSLPQLHASFQDALPCRVNEQYRLDSTTVWVSQIYRFPGTGRQYPLRSGDAAVFAIDAINHAGVVAGGVDLSRAQFEEFVGDGDVDNPFAAKMIRMTRGSTVIVHGYPMVDPRIVGLALPFAQDTSQLQRVLLPADADAGGSLVAFGIPREKVLDAFGINDTSEVLVSLAAYRGGYRNCVPWAAAAFERAPAELYDSKTNLAIRRKSLGRTATGVELLQRTRTGARDFEVAPPLRRSLNK